jgi:hypothetical protein
MWRIPWFRRDAKGEDQNHGKTLGKRELGKDTKANSGDLSSRLSQICGGKTALSAGRVHILSFAGLPERFGKKWSAIEDRVAQLILRILDAHLSKNDLHYELAPRFHALVFADISPEIAALKCAVIAREVMTRLFGDEPFDDCLSIETAQLDKDGNLETNRIDPKLVVIQALESLLPIIEPRVTDTKSSIDDNNPGGDGPATETALSNNHQPVHPPQLQPILERPIRRAPDPNDLVD